MNINLTPEQEQIINDEVKSGHFRSAEEVTAKALVALREKERPDDTGHHDDAVHEMLNVVEKNRPPLHGVSVKQLIHAGHRL
jgi:Arc/MetJ-type ribon-helix-helix transcriptional regulator